MISWSSSMIYQCIFTQILEIPLEIHTLVDENFG
jgi:hypothetical protein